MRIFGIDPGSVRTGYGCVETDGTPPPPGDVRRALGAAARAASRPAARHPRRPRAADSRRRARLRRRSRTCFTRATCGARSCSATRAASPCSPPSKPALPVVEYTPAEIKLAVVGYGRAEKTPGAADGEAAARPRHARRRRTTPPTRWPSRSATRTSGTRAPARRAGAALPRHLRSWRDVAARRSAPAPGAVIAHLSGTLLEKQRAAPRRRRRRRRLRRAGAALDVLRRRRAGRAASRCASTRTCARTRCSSSASRTRARADAVRAADRRQRHRPEGRARGAVGHRAAAISSARSAQADVARLTSIPGVGKKTAERIVARAARSAAADRRDRRRPTPADRATTCATIVLSALANLGYQRAAAEKAVDRVLATRRDARRSKPLLRDDAEGAGAQHDRSDRLVNAVARRRRRAVRSGPAAAHARRLHRPGARAREPAGVDRRGAPARRGARSRAALRPARSRQDDARVRHRQRDGRARAIDVRARCSRSPAISPRS